MFNVYDSYDYCVRPLAAFARAKRGRTPCLEHNRTSHQAIQFYSCLGQHVSDAKDLQVTASHQGAGNRVAGKKECQTVKTSEPFGAPFDKSFGTQNLGGFGAVNTVNPVNPVSPVAL